MTFCCYNHFTGRSRNPTTQVLLVNYKVLKVRNKTGLIFFFFFLNCCSEPVRKESKIEILCVWSYSIFTGLSEHFHSSALLPASPSSWWSSKAVILYLTKKSLIFSWISSLKQLTTCLHKQHDQHKVRIVWLEARREDVTTAGPRHLPKPIQQKQVITFEVLLSNYKISEKLLAPWTLEN